MASIFEPLFAPRPAAAPAWLEAAGQAGTFAALAPQGPGSGPDGQAEQDAQAALARAFAEGERKGRAEAEAAFAEELSARESLRLALARLDEDQKRQLAARLAETVAALCEQALAPLALDRAALERRCSQAARLLGDAVEGASLRLNPLDIDLLGPDFAATWHLLADDTLERGAVCLDTPDGMVLDGPAQWRAALAEALGAC